jgi:hypothetical protein
MALVAKTRLECDLNQRLGRRRQKPLSLADALA